MTEFKFTLNGPMAVVAAILILAVGAIRYTCMWESLKPEHLTVLRNHIAFEEARTMAPALRAAMDSGNHEAADQLAAKSVKPEDIHFDEIGARGSADDLIVRVAVRHKNAAAAGGSSVRYFHMEHSMLTNWKLNPQEPAWWRYWLRLY